MLSKQGLGVHGIFAIKKIDKEPEQNRKAARYENSSYRRLS
jgi:hypothetical protein